MKYISVLFLFFVLTLSAQEKIAVEIKEAWIRPAAAGMNTALFFKVTNHTESVDTLFDASSNAAGSKILSTRYQSTVDLGLIDTLEKEFFFTQT